MYGHLTLLEPTVVTSTKYILLWYRCRGTVVRCTVVTFTANRGYFLHSRGHFTCLRLRPLHLFICLALILDPLSCRLWFLSCGSSVSSVLCSFLRVDSSSTASLTTLEYCSSPTLSVLLTLPGLLQNETIYRIPYIVDDTVVLFPIDVRSEVLTCTVRLLTHQSEN